MSEKDVRAVGQHNLLESSDSSCQLYEPQPAALLHFLGSCETLKRSFRATFYSALQNSNFRCQKYLIALPNDRPSEYPKSLETMATLAQRLIITYPQWAKEIRFTMEQMQEEWRALKRSQRPLEVLVNTNDGILQQVFQDLHDDFHELNSYVEEFEQNVPLLNQMDDLARSGNLTLLYEKLNNLHFSLLKLKKLVFLGVELLRLLSKLRELPATMNVKIVTTVMSWEQAVDSLKARSHTVYLRYLESSLTLENCINAKQSATMTRTVPSHHTELQLDTKQQTTFSTPSPFQQDHHHHRQQVGSVCELDWNTVSSRVWRQNVGYLRSFTPAAAHHFQVPRKVVFVNRRAKSVNSLHEEDCCGPGLWYALQPTPPPAVLCFPQCEETSESEDSPREILHSTQKSSDSVVFTSSASSTSPVIFTESEENHVESLYDDAPLPDNADVRLSSEQVYTSNALHDWDWEEVLPNTTDMLATSDDQLENEKSSGSCSKTHSEMQRCQSNITTFCLQVANELPSSSVDEGESVVVNKVTVMSPASSSIICYHTPVDIPAYFHHKEEEAAMDEKVKAILSKVFECHQSLLLPFILLVQTETKASVPLLATTRYITAALGYVHQLICPLQQLQAEVHELQRYCVGEDKKGDHMQNLKDLRDLCGEQEKWCHVVHMKLKTLQQLSDDLDHVTDELVRLTSLQGIAILRAHAFKDILWQARKIRSRLLQQRRQLQLNFTSIKPSCDSLDNQITISFLLTWVASLEERSNALHDIIIDFYTLSQNTDHTIPSQPIPNQSWKPWQWMMFILSLVLLLLLLLVLFSLQMCFFDSSCIYVFSPNGVPI